MNPSNKTQPSSTLHVLLSKAGALFAVSDGLGPVVAAGLSIDSLPDMN